jgi:hypothetical protein
MAAIAGIDRNCRLIKGQVFLWKQDQHWEDLWDLNGGAHHDRPMTGAYLPGNSTVELREAPVPEPGHGEVLLRMKASTICGSDIRCIYHEHLGKGPEGYQGVIAGHEPCGQIVKAGPAAGDSAWAIA